MKKIKIIYYFNIILSCFSFFNLFFKITVICYLINFLLCIGYCLYNSVNKNFLNKISFLLIILPIVSVQTKLSFSVSFFIIVSTFFIFFLKKLNLKKFIFIFILCFIIGLIPQTLWKQIIYDYPFYNFIINPFPLNIPGYEELILMLKLFSRKISLYIVFTFRIKI